LLARLLPSLRGGGFPYPTIHPGCLLLLRLPRVLPLRLLWLLRHLLLVHRHELLQVCHLGLMLELFAGLIIERSLAVRRSSCGSLGVCHTRLVPSVLLALAILLGGSLHRGVRALVEPLVSERILSRVGWHVVHV